MEKVVNLIHIYNQELNKFENYPILKSNINKLLIVTKNNKFEWEINTKLHHNLNLLLLDIEKKCYKKACEIYKSNENKLN